MTSTSPRDRALVVFTKPAVPGRVKTRLIGPSTPEEAARLHGAFLDDVLAAGVAAEATLVVAWALRDDEPVPAGGWRQAPGDLGARLFDGLSRAAVDHGLVAAVGSDHPEARPADFEEAFEALHDGADVVVRPSDDGGYALIGTRRETLDPGLFAGIAWSTATVLEETLERCRTLGLDVHLLAPGHDVDTPADLDSLVDRLRRDPAACLATRRVLVEMGRLDR